MFNKLKSIMDIFRLGGEVVNAQAWKKGQVTGTIVGSFLMAIVNLASLFGHPLPMDVESANLIGGGIVAVANVVLTFATTSRIGVLQPKQCELAPVEDHSFSSRMPTMEQESTQAAVLTESGAATNLAATIDPLAGLDTTYAG